MVAYSFRKQFGPPILAGTKAQTIRADRKRHARPGEELQLYTGMRTKHCKLVARVPCVAVERVHIELPRRKHPPSIIVNDLDGNFITGATWGVTLDDFAQRDGFRDFDEMVAYWRENHPGQESFRGVLIRWTPLAPADALDIGAAV